MKFFYVDFLLLVKILHVSAKVFPIDDIFLHQHDYNGPAMWLFGPNGVKIFSPDGSKQLQHMPSRRVCPYAENGQCSFFDVASDGHKYVWASVTQSPPRVDVFDIDRGEHVAALSSCAVPIDLDYHPLRQEMWLHCAIPDETKGETGHMEVWSTYAISANYPQTPLVENLDVIAPGRSVVHSTLGNRGYATVYDQPYLFEFDLDAKKVVAKYLIPEAYGSYELLYSPHNQHVFGRHRVCCSCGFDGADVASCGRGGGSAVEILTGPFAGRKDVNGTCGNLCNGTPADTVGVYEFDTVSKVFVATHNIDKELGFGAVPMSNAFGTRVLLMGNDGGKVIKILEVHENGKPSTPWRNVQVNFRSGKRGQQSVHDFAAVMTHRTLVFASEFDNYVVLADMNQNPPQLHELVLDPTATSGGTNIEWVWGSNYVWVQNKETGNLHIIEMQSPGGTVTDAKLIRTLSNEPVDLLLYVENYQRTAMKQEFEAMVNAFDFVTQEQASQTKARIEELLMKQNQKEAVVPTDSIANHAVTSNSDGSNRNETRTSILSSVALVAAALGFVMAFVAMLKVQKHSEKKEHAPQLQQRHNNNKGLTIPEGGTHGHNSDSDSNP